MNDNQQLPNQESYVPKPGDVIKPQRSNNVEVPQTVVPPQSDPDLLTGQSLISLEKTEEIVVSPVATTVVEEPKAKFKLPVVPEKVKKIMKTVVISFVVLIVLGGVAAYFLPMLMPKPEERPPEPIVLPPVVREEPREDKTSLRYLDSKLREIKPSLDELNNDSVFLFELNLNDSDF